MQEGECPEGHLREMAAKCRLMADESLDGRAAASLRKLAHEYEKAAEAARETTSYIAPLNPPVLGA